MWIQIALAIISVAALCTVHLLILGKKATMPDRIVLIVMYTIAAFGAGLAAGHVQSPIPHVVEFVQRLTKPILGS